MKKSGFNSVDENLNSELLKSSKKLYVASPYMSYVSLYIWLELQEFIPQFGWLSYDVTNYNSCTMTTPTKTNKLQSEYRSPESQVLVDLTKSLNQENDVTLKDFSLKKMNQLKEEFKDRGYPRNVRIEFLKTFRGLYEQVYETEWVDFNANEILDSYDQIK